MTANGRKVGIIMTAKQNKTSKKNGVKAKRNYSLSDMFTFETLNQRYYGKSGIVGFFDLAIMPSIGEDVSEEVKIIIRGLKVVTNNTDGNCFISVPSTKGSDGTYYPNLIFSDMTYSDEILDDLAVKTDWFDN